MFDGCPNLLKANISGVTDAVNTNCMRYMFRNCTSLSSIQTNISSWNVAATNNWMANVPAEGWFYMNDTTVVPQRSASGVPEQWNVIPLSQWSTDTDGDSYSDAEENEAGSDSENPNSVPNDWDGDGYSNDEEEAAGSSPDDSSSTPDDRDGDGYSNDDEEAAGTDPDDPGSYPGGDEPDPDDPYANDTDGDGYSDGDEQDAGTDPNDPDSHPEDEPEPDPEEEPEEEP
jgi:hypothetical protein